MERKSKTSLTQKLRRAISNIHVDVFGYEKNVTWNIHSYFDQLSDKTGMPKDRIIVRIFKDYGQVRVCVHKEGKRIKEIPVSELVMLFTGTDPSALQELQQKALSGIQGFMMEYCTAHSVDPDHLHICILTSGGQVYVKGIARTQEISTIPLMKLINHFTK